MEIAIPVVYSSLTASQKKIVREKYGTIQQNRCWYCGNELSGDPTEVVMALKINRKLFPFGFFKNPVHLHHDHDTGLTIGAVHSRCNAMLWQYHGE